MIETLAVLSVCEDILEIIMLEYKACPPCITIITICLRLSKTHTLHIAASALQGSC